MKTETKAFASLSSGLLARKGAARPAMRPQGFGQGGACLEDLGWDDMGFEPPKPAAAVPDAEHDAFGDEVAELPSRPRLAGLTPVESPVHNQQAEIAGRFAADSADDLGDEEDETAELYEPPVDEPVTDLHPVEAEAQPEPLFAAPVAVAKAVRNAKSKAAAGGKAKAAFTLRLDPDRHLKLRLACAVSGQSAQMLVTQAVDRMLAAMPQLDALAQKAKHRG